MTNGYQIEVYRKLKPFGLEWLCSPWEWVVERRFGWIDKNNNFTYNGTSDYSYHDTEFQAVVAAYLGQKEGNSTYYYIDPTCNGRDKEEQEDIKLIMEYRKKHKRGFPDIKLLKFIKENNLTNKSDSDIMTLYKLAGEN